MDIIKKILQNIPLFRHFSEEEIAYLQRIGRLSTIKTGQFLDLKKTNSLNIVISGIFEIEAFRRTDIVYLSPGSFFGSIPFSDNRHQSSVKAIVDSILLIFDEEEIYKLFFVSYKGLRGYIKILSRMGFEISNIGKKYFGENSKVISIYSTLNGSGKSFFASLLGLSLSSCGNTIILDLSQNGNSVFNYFEKKVTPPISHKQVDNSSVERMIHERIERVNDTLDLMNISFGSSVKVDPDILAPILFILSKEYKYILLDLSDYDIDLRYRTFELSDIIFTFVNNTKNLDQIYNIFDSNLKDGQKVYYVINEFFSGEVRDFEGGLILNKFDFDTEIGYYSCLLSLKEQDVLKNFIQPIIEKKRVLVLETNLLDSIFFSGFFSVLEKSNIRFNSFYSSSYSYIMLTLYLLSDDDKDYKSKIINFFSGDRINSFLDITFPEENIFKKNSVSRFATELAGNKRIEMFENIPIAMLCGNNFSNRRMFSTGFLRELITASFLIYPIFESEDIVNNYYNSGYPFSDVRVESLFRTDADEIIYVSVNNKETLKFREDRILKFYRKYIDFLNQKPFESKTCDLADENLVIEVSEKELRVEKLVEFSEEISTKLLNESGFK